MGNFVHQRLVQFADTDLAGIVHFARYLLYMEEAEHAFLRSRGLSVHEERPDGTLCWPRVQATCDYHSPAKFEATLDIAVTVAELAAKAATYRFDIACDGRKVATGKIVAVCCRWAGSGANRTLAAVEIPDDIRRKLAGAE